MNLSKLPTMTRKGLQLELSTVDIAHTDLVSET